MFRPRRSDFPLSSGVPSYLSPANRDLLLCFASDCDFCLLPSGYFAIGPGLTLWVRRRRGGVPACYVWQDSSDSPVARFRVRRGFWRLELL